MKHLLSIIFLGSLIYSTDHQLELLCEDSRWPLRIESTLTPDGVSFTRLDTGTTQCYYRLSLMDKDQLSGFLTLRSFLIE